MILDPEVTLEANAISSFTFTVPVSNPFYNKLELKKPVVSIEEDGREIFMGYITETEKNFELDMEVTCESEFGYLQKDFTFGATTAKLSSLQAGNFATAGKAWNAIQSTIGYINK